jgi:signal transduction histidine kinase
VDRDALAQVLGTLLSNAARHTPDRGRVDVEVTAQGQAARVAVCDTGSGIPAEDLPHVFERFYRVDPSRSASSGGAGIGLSIVAQLVESWGGRVGVESTAGHTEFWFTIPT